MAKAEKVAAKQLDLDARVSGREMCGHVVSGRPPAECACAKLRDNPTGLIAGSDDELAARARALGVPEGAYVRGVRLAEENALLLAAGELRAQQRAVGDVVEALADERDNLDEEGP